MQGKLLVSYQLIKINKTVSIENFKLRKHACNERRSSIDVNAIAKIKELSPVRLTNLEPVRRDIEQDDTNIKTDETNQTSDPPVESSLSDEDDKKETAFSNTSSSSIPGNKKICKAPAISVIRLVAHFFHFYFRFLNVTCFIIYIYNHFKT